MELTVHLKTATARRGELPQQSLPKLRWLPQELWMLQSFPIPNSPMVSASDSFEVEHHPDPWRGHYRSSRAPGGAEAKVPAVALGKRVGLVM